MFLYPCFVDFQVNLKQLSEITRYASILNKCVYFIEFYIYIVCHITVTCLDFWDKNCNEKAMNYTKIEK